jgi:hypothetical protein
MLIEKKAHIFLFVEQQTMQRKESSEYFCIPKRKQLMMVERVIGYSFVLFQPFLKLQQLEGETICSYLYFRFHPTTSN